MVAAEPAARAPADAPVIALPAGRWRVPVVQLPGPRRDFAAQIRIKGSWESLGEVTSTRTGKATLPALRMKQPGTYPVRMVDERGRAYFITLRVQRSR